MNTKFPFTIEISISFNRNQCPKLKKTELVEYFKDEILKNSHTEIEIADNEIQFTNGLSTWALTRFTNRWANLSYGRFRILETNDLFIVEFFGSLKRAFVMSSWPSIFLILVTLFFLRPLNFGLLFMVLLIWPIFFLSRTVIEKITMPIYLNNKKMELLENIRNKKGN